MVKKKIKVVLDTNWYISATINKKSRRALYQLLINNTLLILYSDELIKEYENVISREKFKKIIKAQQAFRFMNLVLSKTKKISIRSNLTGSRDLKDNFLLSLSVDGKADYLVTGDTDLLILEKIKSTNIISFTDFLETIARTTPSANHPDRQKR